jgi:hypothetical protein
MAAEAARKGKDFKVEDKRSDIRAGSWVPAPARRFGGYGRKRHEYGHDFSAADHSAP